MTMTIEQFRATGTDCTDIGAKLSDDSYVGAIGRIYVDALFIEHWTDARAGIAPPHGPTWLLTLGNEQMTGTLAAMELRLYLWALGEGYCDDDAGPTGFRKEFPDFDIADVPLAVLDTGWRDYSWHNDAMPFFVHEPSGVGVWVDYTDISKSDYQDGGQARFIATAMAYDDEGKGWNGWQHDLSGGGVLFETSDTDVLASSLPNFTVPRALAHAFALRIEEECAADLATIRERNASPDYAGSCASHDFCDANMPMAAAFEALHGRPLVPDEGPMADADLALVNAAWDIARVERLTAERPATA